MRVRIAYTTTVDDAYRRALRAYYGQTGLATRAEVRDWLMRHGTAEDDNLMRELDRDDEAA